MKKAFKKVLAIVLALSIIISCVVAIGLTASAAKVEYYTENGKRTGIKSVITDDDIHYFDIADGGMLDDNQKIPEFYIHALTKEYNGTSALKMWANIASHIFEDAGHGTGYSVLPEGNDTIFDRVFTQTDNTNPYTMDLIDVLSKTEATSYGSAEDELMDMGKVESTGLTYFSSLEAVQRKMADLIMIDDLSFYDSEEFLEKATGSKSGFDIADDGNGKPVIASVASSVCVQGHSASSFALAFYDFELIPFVAEDVEFVTAAEGYDSVGDANAATAPGVEYNTSSTGEAFVSYTTNPSREAATTSISFSESSSVSVSNSMESTRSHTYGHSVEVGVELGLTLGKIFEIDTSMKYGFSTQDTIATAYSETNTLTEETSKTSTAEISLPAHTKIGMSQQKTESELVLDYNCPVYITYKVAVIGLNSTGIIGIGWTPKFGSVCTVFGSAETLKGTTATDNLNKRAIQYLDMPSFEESQYYISSNKDKNGIDWKSIIDTTQNNGDKSVRDCVKWLCGNIPLSVAGAKLTMKQNGVETKITDIKPLYNLNYVTANDTTAYSLAVGGAIDLLDVSTKGFNQHSVPYYGYIPIKGTWSVCDANGNPVTDETGITIEKPSYTQILTANKIGDYYVRFNIDEKTYTDVDDSTKYITNADLTAFPIIKISVTNTGENHNCVASEWITTIPATCFMEGAQVKKCLTCGIQMETQTLEKTAHTNMIVTTPATCTEKGSVITSCGICGEAVSTQTIDAEGHDDGIWKVDFEATHEHKGQMSLYCTKCGEALETKEISLHTHEKGYEKIITPATCTQHGEKGVFCKICDAMYETEQLEKSGHGEKIDIVTLQPTCTADGEKTSYCIDCNMMVGVVPVSATGHDDGVWKVDFEATADHGGQMSRYCSKCGEVLETKDFSLHEHTEGYTKTTPATCTQDGEKSTFCAVCGAVYKTETVSAKGHGETFAVTTVKATCTKNGEKTLFCSDCHEAVDTEEIKANGHSGDTYVVAANPTCTQAGEEILYCDACGEIIGKKELSAKGHSAKWLTVEEATCTKYGREEKTCTECGVVLDTRRIEKAEHIPGKWEITQPSTCTQSGLMQQACALCSALIGQPVVIEPHEHQAGSWVTVLEPDCENEGEKVQSCTVCKGAIKTESIPALGHTFSDWHSNNNGNHSRTCLNCTVVETNNCDYDETVTAQTCTEGGYTTYVCSVCDHTYISDYTDALGHDWSEWTECEDGCCHERECQQEGCNATETQNHNWGEWIYNEDGKFFCNGTKTRACDSCGATETDEAQHTSFFGKVFYPVIVFFGNIVHKIIWIFSLNWLFPDLTITPQI